MRKRDARHLSPSQLDELRSRAIALWKMGCNRRAIAALLEVHYNSVGRWVSAFELEGPGAIVSAKRGRKAGGSRSLSAAQERSVQKMITDKTPDQLKMPFALWTRRAVCELVQASFGIPLPERTCGEYLRRWGFTAQRPARRHYEQNPKAVAPVCGSSILTSCVAPENRVRRFTGETKPVCATTASTAGGSRPGARPRSPTGVPNVFP